jgi:phage baseplate assembly protein W
MVAFVTTPAAQVSTPHFAFPFQLGKDGAFQVVEQDSLDEIVQSVQVLVGTQLGSREELPEYGIEDPTFSAPVDVVAIQTSIEEWEDRAAVDIERSMSTVDELLQNVVITIGLDA